MVASKVATGSAILIAYTLFCFCMQPTTSATPNLRGGVPSLYMKPTATASPGLRGAPPVETSPTLSQTDARCVTNLVFEVMAVLVAMVTVAQCIPTWRSPTCITTIGCAVLIAYAIFSLCIQSSMNVTPRLRGAMPTLYMQPVLLITRGLRSGAIQVAGNEVPRIVQGEASFGPNVGLEVVGVLVAVMTLAQRVPPSRSPTRVTTTVAAVLIAYTMFCLGTPPSMSVTPHLRGAMPSLYMQAVLGTSRGLRGVATEVARNEMPTVVQDETSLGPNACLEVVCVIMSVMALAKRVAPSRSPTRMTTTVAAILIVYALFSLGAPPSMDVTPRLRGGIPSFYVKPALTSSLRDIFTDAASDEMQTPDLDEDSSESYRSFTDLTDVVVQNFSPIAYWGALSFPAMAMAHLTQRKEHSKLN